MRSIDLSLGPEQQNLLEYLRYHHFPMTAECGGHGNCGKCRVLFSPEEAPLPSAADREIFDEMQLAAGWRLACCHSLSGDYTIFLPSSDREEEAEIVKTSAFLDKKADERLSENLWTKAGEETGAAAKEVAARDSGAGSPAEDRTGGQEVIALDLGTTSLAAARLSADGTLRTAGAINHQRIFGADVIARIQAANEGHLYELQAIIRRDLNQLVRHLGCEPEQVPMVVSANTTMGHLLQGYSCEGLGKNPCRPVNLSLHREGSCLMLPGISAYLGADVVSGIVASGMDRSAKISLLVDLGTNGEMVLGSRDRMLGASAAAGPAFEGGNISQGMPGLPGAVSEVDLVYGRMIARTIGGRQPVGICGTGVLEAVWALRQQALIDETGLLVEEYRREGCYVAGKVRLTQKDIREVQLAKAAVRAGIDILLRRYGIRADQVDQVFLAGGFGQKLNPYKAEAIGLLPAGMAARARPVGNTSLAGAIMAARALSGNSGLSRESRDLPPLFHRFRQAAVLVEEIPLAEEKDFESRYISCLGF